MKRPFSFCFFIIVVYLCILFSGICVKAASTTPYVRVRIYEGAAPVVVSGDGGVEFSSADGIGPRAMSQPGVKTTITKNGTDLILEPPAEAILPVNGSESPDTKAEPVTIYHNSIVCRPLTGRLVLGKAVYRGNFEIVPTTKGYRVINELPMEEYLYGVVNSEMPKTWPLEALKAQVVAARTYALQNMLRHGSEGYNLCSTTHCQAYGGVGTESSRGIEAVNATFGLAATYQGGLISAVFHSTSGGMTEASSVVWGSAVPYLKAVESTELGSPYSQWSVSMTPAEVSSMIAKAGLKVGSVIDIVPITIGQSGRVGLATVKGTAGEVNVKGEALRSALGLRSTLFWTSIERVKADNVDDSSATPEEARPPIQEKPDDLAPVYDMVAQSSDPVINNIFKTLGVPTRFTFYGRGYGHGVGMSQYGAKTKADLGYTYDRILKHYYQGIEIKKWYGE